MKKLISFSHGYGQISYHIVLVPKYRHKAFMRNDIKFFMRNYITALTRKYRWNLHALEIMDDHIHIFMDIPPTLPLSQVIGTLKSRTAHEIFKIFPIFRDMFREGHFWSRGKFFRSVGTVTSETIERYILESQGKHHHTKDSYQSAKKENSLIKQGQTTIFDFAS